jgi:hypothetical protein
VVRLASDGLRATPVPSGTPCTCGLWEVEKALEETGIVDGEELADILARQAAPVATHSEPSTPASPPSVPSEGTAPGEVPHYAADGTLRHYCGSNSCPDMNEGSMVRTSAAPPSEGTGSGESEPAPWMKVGARVDYHSLINPLGPVTLGNAEIRAGPDRLASGGWVVWLKGKSGCVSIEAITPSPSPSSQTNHKE